MGLSNPSGDFPVAPDAERVKVESFDCKCQNRHVAGVSCIENAETDSGSTHEELKQTKRGCIAQFTVGEILAKRMDMAELTEGKLLCFIKCLWLCVRLRVRVFLCMHAWACVCVCVCVCVCTCVCVCAHETFTFTLKW